MGRSDLKAIAATQNLQANRKTYEVENEDGEYIHRKSKKSGKRFHRKKQSGMNSWVI